MKERKNIDRLFQERFKDFEAHPSAEVWAKIEDRLGQKRRRRIIPLWWKLGGAAALLALLFVVGNLYFSPTTNFPSKNNDQFVTADSSEIQKEKSIAQPKSATDSTDLRDNTVVSNIDQKAEKTGKKGSKSTKNKDKLPISSSVVAGNSATSAEGENKTGKKERKSTKNNQKLPVSSSEGIVASDQSSTEGENGTGKISEKNKKTTENSVAYTSEKTGKNAKKRVKMPENRAVLAENKTFEQDSISEKNKKALVNSESQIEETDELSEEKSLDQIVQEEQAANAVDETAEKQRIESKRWALMPNIAPVYYDSFGGSGIAPQFDGNSKEGRINLSYGLLVSYALTDKLTVRSGLSKIDLSYNTNDAILYTGAQAGTLQSLNFNEKTDVVQVESAVRANSDSPISNADGIPEVNAAQGYVNQSLAYFEVPMELEYALIENRVGLQVIGGLSTLFLNDSGLTFSDSDFKTSLPQSSNLNDVSFSTNVGLGLDYKFTDAVKFNVQPMFKYQLNAYKNDVSGFKPYYLGLYTGFSIKF